ncbi:hypothetical protein [Vibrio phage JSF7]|uniref:Uncharacterized protein n=1 Tax=Vibrio phage JSF7 TaxID=1292086 RepID=A0A240EWX1_9CAUD|nr:hypothetical protein HOQ92_gp40 [Vibrio phage JSF7]APD18164.1 hypothetical protein [Vibrio phage JSF7]
MAINVNVGLQAQPLSSALERQLNEFLVYRVPRKAVVPSMTESEVRFEQGMMACMEHIHRTLVASAFRVLNAEAMNVCNSCFRPLSLDLNVPISTIMFDSGWNKLLELLNEYHAAQASSDHLTP